MAQMMFVAGVARSGTTALRAVLGTHPDLAIGMERFKRLWGAGIDQLTPELFERDRFFAFEDGLTNITPDLDWAQERLADLDAKWDTARYRGDKMTVIRAQRLWQTFPDARFVFVVRELAHVASSWERRSVDTDDDTWRSAVGATESVAAWNTAVQRVAKAVTDRPEQAMVVEYHRFFGDPSAASLRAIMDFLELDVTPILGVWEQSHRTYVDSVAGRDRTLAPEIAAFVAEQGDTRAWARVVGLAR